MEPLRYRTDILGLRAVAVVPIVLVHAGFGWMRGGIYGVDIFFVISGYLITALLCRDMAAGRFDVLAFYRRRAVRILPALVVMLVLLLSAGWLLLLPWDLRDVARNAAAAAGFVANVYAYVDTDYFSKAAVYKPLLHLWSLGVEEQFYLLYPAFLLAVRRWWPKRMVVALAALTLASAASAVLLTRWQAEAAFYLLPGRVWELTLGGLVAFGVLPHFRSSRIRHALASLGLAVTLIALVALDPQWPYPTVLAALPCGGAALAIAYGDNGPTARLLAFAPLRWIGAISYSLYLWHWPILAMWRIENGATLASDMAAALIALAALAATASYWLVERPARRRWRRARPGAVLGVALAALAGLAGTALALPYAAPRWHYVDPKIARFADYLTPGYAPDYAYQYRPDHCFALSKSFVDPRPCLQLDDRRPNVLLIGDSHAADLWRALSERYRGINLMQGTSGGCKPLLANVKAKCKALIHQVFGAVLDTKRVSRVVLAARWRLADSADLPATIRFLKAKHVAVTVLGPQIVYEEDLPRLLVRATRRGDAIVHLPANVAETRNVEQALRSTTEAAGARYVSLDAAMCPAGRCRVVVPPGRSPLYADAHHLSLPGARWLVTHLHMF